MTPAWLAVILVGSATVAIKAAGPILLGGRAFPPKLLSVLGLLAPALLAALVATQGFSTGRELKVDARAAGLLVAAAGAHLRAPALAVVVGAAAVTAAVRLFFQ